MREERERKPSDVSSYKDTNPIGSEPYPKTSFNLNYLLIGLISKHSHTGGLGLQHIHLGSSRDKTIQSKTSGPISLPDFNIYYIAIVTKTVWYWQRDRHTDQWSRTENTETDPTDF